MCFRPAEAEANELNLCPECGISNPPGVTECLKCGAPIAQVNTAKPIASPAGTPAAPAAPNVPSAPAVPKAPAAQTPAAPAYQTPKAPVAETPKAPAYETPKAPSWKKD